MKKQTIRAEQSASNEIDLRDPQILLERKQTIHERLREINHTDLHVGPDAVVDPAIHPLFLWDSVMKEMVMGSCSTIYHAIY